MDETQANVENEASQEYMTETEKETGKDEQPPESAKETKSTILGKGEGTDEVTYDFRGIVPEGMEYDEDAAKGFAGIAKELGLSENAANKAAQYGMKWMQDTMAAVEEAHICTIEDWGKSATEALGKDFESTVRQAGTAIERLETVVPGIRQALNETGVGNRIEFIRAFAAIGAHVGEDTFHGLGASVAAPSKLYPNTTFINY